ncbi:MAG TPA: hypothetical protein PKD55_10075 [Bellilinea sp.]|nr:hypothetical protein [Bellilinea sp.]
MNRKPLYILMLTMVVFMLTLAACSGGGSGGVATKPAGGEATKTVEEPKATDAPVMELTTAPATEGAPSNVLTVTVKNQSPIEICEIYLTKETSEDWGDDLLLKSIRQGETGSVSREPGTYDILVADCDSPSNSVYSGGNINVSSEITIGGSGTVALRIQNKQENDVCYIHFAPSSEAKIGDDRLGGVEIVPQDYSRYFFVHPDTYNVEVYDCDDNLLNSVNGLEVKGDTTWEVVAP